MSALGQKQTFAVQTGMSALPPKADMCSATRHVRFVPIADSCTAAKPPRFSGETFAINGRQAVHSGDATISPGDTVNAAWPLSM